jgi:hypothetical protein
MFKLIKQTEQLLISLSTNKKHKNQKKQKAFSRKESVAKMTSTYRLTDRRSVVVSF